MRIAHVNDIAHVGSALVRALRTAGVDAELIEPARPGASIPYPWKLATLPFRAGGLLAAGARIRAGRYDLVHVHYARLAIVGPLSGRPYIVHCHGSDVRGVVPGSPWGLEIAPFLRGAALVYYVTPDLAPWVTSFRRDAVYMPNPIEPPLPAAGTGPPERDLLVGVRLDPIKGIEAIATTVEAVVRRRPSTTVTIVDQGVGVGLVRAVAGPATHVIRPVSHESMPGLFRAHRMAVGQLRVGALGNYELEAMAAGTPVAASFRFPAAYDAPPPIASDDTPAALADRVVALLDDEPARTALAAAGQHWVAEYHAADAVAARVAADYRRILEG